jgi:GH24 family phage-related lysozyme (muramidase)
MGKEVPQCAIDLIKKFEGYAKQLSDGGVKAYPNPKVGWALPTIGWGTTRYPDGSRVKRGDVITDEEAQECLMAEVDRDCRPALEKIPTWEKMNDNQRGALYSFAYNLGAHFYRGANFQSITKVCDSPDLWGDSDWIRDQFIKYRNPGTSVEEGLRRRREAEAELFCTPIF